MAKSKGREMYEPLTVTIEGTTPTLMHNGQLADPLNKWSKAIKVISGKRKKTDSDHEEMARLEFLGGLYLDKNLAPCWPGENIKRMLVDAAKKSKSGPSAKIGLLVQGDFPLIYDGPKDANKLWEDERFRSRVSCKVQTSRVMRTRPIFRDWKLRITVQHDPDIVNRDTVIEWIETAGRQIGLSDWRPDFGSFVLVD